jgi:hypothetical protein
MSHQFITLAGGMHSAVSQRLRQAARCGAKTRSGAGRRRDREKARCRMRDGAKGSGKPKGVRNGNYRYTEETMAIVGG